MKEVIKIGVVGYSDKSFDEKIGKALLILALKLVEKYHEAENYELVSGYSNMGIPKLAYEIAKDNGWKTVGLSAKEVKQYDCYKVDKEIIKGEKFGDESEYFLDYIDVFVRVGGGNQSMKETKMAKEKNVPVYEYDLPREK